MLSHRVHHPEVSSQQYAVMLVDEDQLDDLMRRPSMRRVNSGYGPQDVYARYQRLKRRTAVAAVLLLLVAAGAGLYFVAPQPAMASVFPWTATPAVPTLLTGASFSVTVASLESADGATVAAARVRNLGLPAFTRRSPGKQLIYQAMVGPYASLDEAEQAQRRLGAMGYRGARLFVDESLRGSPRGSGPVDAADSNPGVLLLGAPDRVSLVFELQSEPREVKSSRPDGTSLVVDAGPMTTPAHPQRWSAPESVHLVQTVGIDAASTQTGLHYMRARVELPEFAKANVRNEGRRVYVDLTWPVAEDDLRVPRRQKTAPAEGQSRAAAEPTVNVQAQRYREAMEPIHQRITEVKPFLLSAARSGSVEVFAALDQTLASLESSLLAVQAPPPEAGQHQLLVSATRTARRGLEPSFTGDRLAHAQKAIEMFDGAMARPIPAAQ